MARRDSLGVLFALALVIGSVKAQDDVPSLEEAFDAAVSWTQGQSRLPLGVIEQAVRRDAGAGAGTARIERRLLDLLEREDATDEARVFACRQLALVGTGRAVPALVELVTEPAMSHPARLALQAIPAPAATAALIGALERTDGPTRLGVVRSLGRRGDPNATAALVAMLLEQRAGTGEWDATLEAILQIGGPGVASELEPIGGLLLRQAERGNAMAFDALIESARVMAHAGRIDDARELFAATLGSADRAGAEAQRLAALERWMTADPRGGLPYVTVWRGDDEPATRGTTVRLLAAMRDPEATTLLVEHLLEVVHRNGSRALQVDLIETLTRRGDVAAAPVIAELAGGSDERLSDAAITALGVLGSSAHVPLLATMAAQDRSAAAASLRRMRGPGVEFVMVGVLGRLPAGPRLELARALGDRVSGGATDGLLRAADAETDAAVRAELLRALGQRVSSVELPRFAALVTLEEDAEVRVAANDAYVVAAERLGAESAVRELMYAPLRLAAVDDPARLKLIGRIGGETAAALVGEAMRRDDAGVVEAAVTALAAWPDDTQCALLLETVRTTSNEAHRKIAYDGLVRSLGLPGEREPGETVAMYRQAMTLARSDDQRRSALIALGGVADPAALELALEHLEDDAVGRSAADAVVAIAAELDPTEGAGARTALEAALDRYPRDETLRVSVGDAMNRIEREEGFVYAWMMAGPYRKEDVGGGALFDVAFAPEPGAIGQVEWRPVPREAIGRPGIVDLKRALGGDNVCAYLATVIRSTRARPARLEIGSDDGVRVWLNGREVHANNVMRGLTAGEDVVEVELEAGRNELLMKITQGGGDWRGCCRLRRPDGFRLDVTVERPR